MRALGLGQYDDRGVIPEDAFAENARTDVLENDTRRGTNRDLRVNLAQTAWLNLAALLIDTKRESRRQQYTRASGTSCTHTEEGRCGATPSHASSHLNFSQIVATPP